MNAFREALADKYQYYQLPSLEEVLDKVRKLKREFPRVNDDIYDFIVKDMTKMYGKYRREYVTNTVIAGLVVYAAPIIIPHRITVFKEYLEQDFKMIRKTLDEVNKVPSRDQDNVFNSLYVDIHATNNTNQEKFKREEEVAEPLITPVPKEMGTTNPLVRPDATETINPLAKR